MKMQGEMTLLRVHVRSDAHRTWHSPPAAGDLVEPRIFLSSSANAVNPVG